MRPCLYIKQMFPFILSIFFPGLGQVLLSRHLKGLFIFFSVIILLDFAFIILPLTLQHYPAYIQRAAGYTVVVIYLYNLWDIFNIVYYRHRKSLREKKEALLKEGITYYLQNDFNKARAELKRALKLDNDDIDILYYLSRIESAAGDPVREKHLLNRLGLLDFDKKWEK
jgi:tetratricopeptide (TPR) repeat protein